MAQSVTITVQPRDAQKNKGTGSRVSRRIRASGRIPAIIYGHKQPPQPISLTNDDAWLLIKKQSHLATLQVDGKGEMVLVRDIQWDHLGKEILHLDFSRVSADETVDTRVTLHFVGTPVGVAEGGVFEVLAHELAVECKVTAIPDEIRVDTSHLKIGDSIHSSDLTLPAGVTMTGEGDLLLAHVTQRGAAAETTTAVGEPSPAEPEIIGRKVADDKGEAEKDKK